MQANIIGVFVNGSEVSRDTDLLGESSFEVVSSRGNRYTVVRQPGAPRSCLWQVTLISKSGVNVDIATGRITGVRSLFARNPTSFKYVSAHNILDGGFQNDFLNAVQSLTD